MPSSWGACTGDSLPLPSTHMLSSSTIPCCASNSAVVTTTSSRSFSSLRVMPRGRGPGCEPTAMRVRSSSA